MAKTNEQLTLELDQLRLDFDTLIANATTIPKLAIDIDDTEVTDKTNWVVYGNSANIHGNKFFMGRSSVATPTTDAHISEFIHKSLT